MKQNEKKPKLVLLLLPLFFPLSSISTFLSNLSLRPDIQLALSDAENAAVHDLVQSDAAFLFVFSFVALESLFCPEVVHGKEVISDNLLQGLLDLFFSPSNQNKHQPNRKAAFVILDAGTGKTHENLSGSLLAIQSFISAGKESGRFCGGVVCEVLQPDPKNLALLIHTP